MRFFNQLTKLTLEIIETPVAVVKDIATMGGTLTDNDKPYTQEQLEDLQSTWDEMKESLDD